MNETEDNLSLKDQHRQKRIRDLLDKQKHQNDRKNKIDRKIDRKIVKIQLRKEVA